MGCLSKYFWELRRARREYRCSHCGAVIKPGELYVYYFGVGMGTNCRVERARYCLPVPFNDYWFVFINSYVFR